MDGTRVRATMNQQILCSWLGLADKSWPPPPHALLGVDATETDLARIEQQVHDRLCRLRCYQISHPEEATEGMNRLAQAFIEITETLSRNKKKATPVTIAVARLPCPKATQEPWPTTRKRAPTKDDTAVGWKTEVDWRNTPPPVRADVPCPSSQPAESAATVEVPAAEASTADLPVPCPDDFKGGQDAQADVDPQAPPLRPLPELPATPAGLTDAVAIELAHRSPEAWLGLGTLAALLQRITHMRRLRLAWKHAGKYLAKPQRRITRPAEEKDLTHRLDHLFDVIDGFPGFVGQPGKPGYRVVAMARLEMTDEMFKILDAHQREELARDWEAGEKVLREHHRFLRKQLRAHRRRGVVDRLASAVEGFICAHRIAVSVGGLLALASLIFIATR